MLLTNPKTALGILMSFCLLFTSNIQAQFKVVGYLTNWGSFVADAQEIDYNKITHVNIAFINPNSKGVLAPTKDLSTVTQIIHTNGALALASLGGATANASTWASYTNATNRTSFISKIVKFTKDFNLDGVDVDLEGQLINSSYNDFVQELADSLHAQDKLCTTAIGTWQGDLISDLTLAKYDLINVMSYDYYGTWTGQGQHSPYSGAESELIYWTITRNIPKEKVILGVPSYGYYWSSLGAESINYTDLVELYPRAVHQDSINTSTGVIYYNGIETIKEKTVLALAKAGGIMMWTIQNDLPTSDTNSLIRAIAEIIQSNSNNLAPSVNITNPQQAITIYEGDSLLLSANASDKDGNITRVSFYYDKVKISDSYNAPYTSTWRDIGPGKFKIYAKATDNAYSSAYSDTITITVLSSPIRKPYQGKPWNIPGKIEAENFDIGNTLGYYDTDTINNGDGMYRSGPVDIETCTDTLGGYDIGWSAPNEWLKYSINVTKDTLYQIQVRYSSLPGMGKFHIEKNDTNITGTITVPSTRSWQIWKNITIKDIKLTANDTVLKFVFETGDFNINYFKFDYASATSTGIEDEVFANTTKLVLFPNPCENEIQVQYNLKNNTETSLQILDLLGRTVYELHEYQSNGLQSKTINTSNFAKGVYQILLNGKAEKFIVK